MLEWHKKYVEKTLKSFGMSNYKGMWVSFIKGLIIGGLIIYIFLINDDKKITPLLILKLFPIKIYILGI
tara:strand:- start:5769 stop:5975 length:207 start_codon:yes stop_codon:yes gene_type:complete